MPAATVLASDGRGSVFQYAILIYDNEAAAAEAGPDVVDAVFRRHAEFAANNAARVLGSQRLWPSHTATSVRRCHDEPVVTDGVFAETKEILGGFYLIEATDLDEALAIAKQVPAPWGGVEIRPLRPDPA